MVLFFRIEGSSERSEREIFFLEGEMPDHLIGAAVSQPQQLSCFVAVSERSERKKFFLKRGVGSLTVAAVTPERRNAGAVSSRCERATRARRENLGHRPARGGGVSVLLVGAGLEGDSKFFWNRV